MKILTFSLISTLVFAITVMGESVRLDPLVRQTHRAIPFCVTGAAGNPLDNTIAKVVRKDLSKHGAFNAARISGNDEKTLDQADRRTGKVHFKNWANLGAQILGKIKSKNGKIEFYLYTPYNGARVFAKRYRGNKKSARKVGHLIADDIIQAILHEKGFFSSQLLFVKGDIKSKNIYIANSDGTGMKALTKGNTLCVFPDWFPDGRNILFTSYFEGRPIIYKMSLNNGKARRLLAMPGMNICGAVAPNGRKLAAILDKDGQPELYVIDLATGKRKRLTHGRAVESSPSWSPDSRKIVYSSDEAGGRPQIYTISASGGRPHRLTTSSFSRYCTSPTWSPDGKKIAFVAQLAGNYDVCLYDFASKQLYQLTTNPNNDEGPSWACDSRHIAYSRVYGRTSKIRILDSETGKTAPLIQSGEYCGSPAWEP
ncbi:MAG: hypothetical protein DRI44_04385 [Chlamydiae bacterium]|nr:MAG: hypothetical protein DRI44_04385 [Chlamydiota bacterium]